MEDKHTMVVEALANNEDLADWYREVYGVTAGDFTVGNVYLYGTGGFGDIADAILFDHKTKQLRGN